ncbi:MarR family winged helix-turn-helix transcriptional regulator [Actinoplanes sp. NPDC051861]|uniref:MarR family winged helix-turn-helix transcriptional regulator n=1 Tax=Actinoplanes sp. NPDC051861 TaxID=3155170 RepID=UPI003416887F
MFERSVRGHEIYEIVRLVRPLVLNSARVVETRLKPHNLTVGMRAVLEILAESGPTTVPTIAARLDLARQGVQRHVNDLIELGHVEQQENPAHRRSVLIALTPAGTERFGRIRDDELRELSELAPECSADDITTTVRVLTALHRDIRRKAAG